LKIYEEVIKILSLVVRDGDVSFEDLMKFRTSVSEADFLFRQDIPEYINEIYKRGVNLRKWKSLYRDFTQDRPDDYDHENVVEQMHIELNWLIEQFGPVKLKFRKYLDISH
jgi:hypothetical protein